MTSLSLKALAIAHDTYIAGAESRGARVLSYDPPCGCPSIKTTVPKHPRQTWDSLSLCPKCGVMHFKKMQRNSVEVECPDIKIARPEKTR